MNVVNSTRNRGELFSSGRKAVRNIIQNACHDGIRGQDTVKLKNRRDWLGNRQSRERILISNDEMAIYERRMRWHQHRVIR